MRENRRILIVDDDDTIHASVKTVLTLSDPNVDPAIEELENFVFGTGTKRASAASLPAYTIDSAYQGEEALKMTIDALAANDPYALIFMDMRMPPGWGGLRTIQEVWKVAPDTEIVILSAYSDHSWNDFIELFGSTDRLFILRKPFHAIELQQIANALVRKWNLSHQLAQHLASLKETTLAQGKQISEQQVKLTQSEQLATVGKAASSLVHEMKASLGLVLTTAENLRGQIQKDQQVGQRDDLDKKLQTIVTATLKLGKMTNELAAASSDSKK